HRLRSQRHPPRPPPGQLHAGPHPAARNPRRLRALHGGAERAPRSPGHARRLPDLRPPRHRVPPAGERSSCWQRGRGDAVRDKRAGRSAEDRRDPAAVLTDVVEAWRRELAPLKEAAVSAMQERNRIRVLVGDEEARLKRLEAAEELSIGAETSALRDSL